MENIITEIKQQLHALANEEKAKAQCRFFKTGKGEYAEGDLFIGVSVPQQRLIAKQNWNKVELKDLQPLITSPIHEERLTALLILIEKMEKAKQESVKKDIVEFYLQHLNNINNWDLVDTSCYKILGRYCFESQSENMLLDLSKSKTMWHKRIAVVATLYFIKKQSFCLTQTLVKQELQHPHDLMHKANGWMLCEMGKVKPDALIEFLEQHYTQMPRTTLRYAIEKLSLPLKQHFMKR